MGIFSLWSGNKDFESTLTDKQKPLFEEFKTKVEALEQDVTDRDEMIANLNEQLKDAQSAPKAGPQVITIGKEKLTILIPSVKVPGLGIVTAQDLKENKLKVGEEPVFDYLKRKKSGMFIIESE